VHRKTKFFLILFFSFLFFSCDQTITENQILGVWNTGPSDEANKEVQITQGSFTGSEISLIIDYNEQGEKTIRYDGGGYRILAIHSDRNLVLLNLEYDGDRLDSKEHIYDCIISGKVKMHFKNNDEVWFEVVEKESDADFSKADFKGKELIYWRAKHTR